MVDVGKYLAGRFLAFAHLEHDSEVVEIQGTKEDIIEGKEKLLCKFKEYEQPLILNKTNLRVLSGAWGEESTAWHGERIEIYKTTAEYQGEIKDALRLRLPKQTAAQPDWKATADSEW